jgi:hypothetical protein
LAMDGVAKQGNAWLGKERRGKARQGVAKQGKAWLGTQGVVRQARRG